MAIQHLSWAVPHAVTVWVPNEREGQILGGTPTHADSTTEACKTLRTHATRHGLDWQVRQEAEIRYQRAVYTRPQDRIGTLYPDCLVAIGVQELLDEPYDLARIGIPPVLVIEIISKKTRMRDIGVKVAAYAQMGILEYLTFDPRPRRGLELHGYRLAGPEQYALIPPAAESGLWLSSVDLRVDGEYLPDARQGARLRFYSRTGERLLHTDEEAALRLEEQEKRRRAEGAVVEERALRLHAEHVEQEAQEKRLRAETRATRLEALLAEHGIAAEDLE